MTARLAVDIGGTFTDLAIEKDGQRWTAKVLTTPAAPEKGVLEGVGVGADSPSEMSQDHYLARVVKLGPVRTSKEMCLPSDLATKEITAIKDKINEVNI